MFIFTIIISKILGVCREKNYRKVVSNCCSLLLLQAGNYVVPLILTPYLILTLGIEGFGTLSFAIAVNVFFRTFVSYGFDMTGTKMIAENSTDLDSLSHIFQDIIYSKLVILVFCLIFLIILTSLFPIFEGYKSLLFLFFGLVVADVFFPVWLYQGMEKMKAITFFKLSGRFLFVILTILLIKTNDDILFVPLIEGTIAILVAFTSFFWGINRFSITFSPPSYRRIIFMLKDAFYVFISKISVLFYTRFNVVLLGMMTTPSIVGYYSIAERVYMAIREMFNPFIQAIFPYLSKIKLKQKNKYYKLIKISFVILLVSLILLSLSLNFVNEQIVNFLVEGNQKEVSDILFVFTISLVFAIGGFLSMVLILEERGKELSKITLLTVVLNLIIVYPLIDSYGAIGLAMCFLIVQFIHFIIQIFVNRRIFTR